MDKCFVFPFLNLKKLSRKIEDQSEALQSFPDFLSDESASLLIIQINFTGTVVMV